MLLETNDRPLVQMLERRFHRFLNPAAEPDFRFAVTVDHDSEVAPEQDLEVFGEPDRWTTSRGDFRAEWNVRERRGRIQQALNPYAADSVLRIVHTLVLAEQDGFLLHASSAIRNGRAFVFMGPSGSGKSTIVGLAPEDVTVLTDEVSYLKKIDGGYVAFGTPFAGEKSDLGEPACAPVAGVFALGWNEENRREPLGHAAAVRSLMRNILFFARDRALVDRVFDTACDCAASVPAETLSFAPDARVWSMLE